MSSKEWHKELLLAWLFQTCFKLQTVLDRHFLHFGITFQEATVLMRCVEAREIVPSRLALVLAKDKGKITRFIDRLEAAELIKRLVNARDRRFSVIKATPRGKRLAERIATALEEIRQKLFVDVIDGDIRRLGRALPQLQKNALKIGPLPGRQARRIGERKDLSQNVGTIRAEETRPAMEPSSAKTESQNTNVCERRDERVGQAHSTSLANEPEEAITALTELVPSREAK